MNLAWKDGHVLRTILYNSSKVNTVEVTVVGHAMVRGFEVRPLPVNYSMKWSRRQNVRVVDCRIRLVKYPVSSQRVNGRGVETLQAHAVDTTTRPNGSCPLGAPLRIVVQTLTARSSRRLLVYCKMCKTTGITYIEIDVVLKTDFY